MSVEDYNSLGKTFMQVMHNYLPSEQSKLQFISGKILDIFYDEFIKFTAKRFIKSDWCQKIKDGARQELQNECQRKLF